MSGSTCPYCRGTLAAEDEIVTCSGCAAKHHADCLLENGGCTVFGCSEAPEEEAKINVSDQDLTSSGRLDGNGMLPASRTPPPPPPTVAGSTPPPPRAEGIPYFSLPAGNLPAGSIGEVQEIPYLTFAGYAPRPLALPSGDVARKSRVVFVLLAVLLGAFGGHNFYAGYVKKAVIQLCITLLSCFAGCFISWIWAIVEACVVDRDDDGMAFL